MFQIVLFENNFLGTAGLEGVGVVVVGERSDECGWCGGKWLWEGQAGVMVRGVHYAK